MTIPSARIYRKSVALSAITAGSLFLSLGNQLIIAAMFGVSIEVDTLIAASSVPWFVFGIVTAMLNYSGVPVLVRARASDQTSESFASDLFWSVTALAVGATLFGIYATRWYFPLLATERTPVELFHAISVLSWCAAGLGIAGGVLGAIENANNRFQVKAAMSLSPYGGMCVAGLALSKSLGIVSIPLGQLVGHIAAVAILFFRNRVYLARRPRLIKFRGSAIPTLVAALTVLCYSVSGIVDSYWTRLLDAGSLSSLGFASRISIAVGSILVVGPLAILGTRLTELYLAGATAEFDRSLKNGLSILVLVSLPALLLSIAVGDELVIAVFERGRFSREASAAVAGLLPLMMAGMIANLLASLVMKALISVRHTWDAAVMSLVYVVVYAASPSLTIGPWGVKGMAAVYAIAWWCSLIAGAILLARSKHIRIEIFGLLKFVARIALALVGFGVGIWISNALFHGFGAKEDVFTASLMAAVVGTAVYAITALLFVYPKISQVDRP